MADLPKRLAFVTDDSIPVELRSKLLELIINQSNNIKDGQESKENRSNDNRRYWHNTPLVVALVGLITIAGNGLVTYITKKPVL